MAVRVIQMQVGLPLMVPMPTEQVSRPAKRVALRD